MVVLYLLREVHQVELHGIGKAVYQVQVPPIQVRVLPEPVVQYISYVPEIIVQVVGEIQG
ncbi:hypothetical protein TAMYLO_640002 [Tenacibaculum amylolyticum]